MGTNATWQVNFNDGTSIEVRATCKRMAKANASVEARKPPEHITGFFRKDGKARNGKRRLNPNRNKKAWQRQDSAPSQSYGSNDSWW